MSEQYVKGTIEELCNVEYGTRVVRKKNAGTLYPVYGGGGETFFLDTFNREDRVVIARFAMSEKCTRRVTGKFALNDSGLTLSPRDPAMLTQDYLDYCVLGMNDQIYSSARGTAQKNLDVPAFRKMEISFPASLERQEDIIYKLDNAFAEIHVLERNLAQLRKLHSELLFSIQMNSFRKNVNKVKIGEVCKLMTGGTPSRTRDDFFENGTVKWLVSGDIHKVEIHDCEGRITAEAMKSANTKILPINSVMIALNGQGKTRGTVAILRTEATCNQSLVSISPVNVDQLMSEFLFYNLKMRYQEIRRMTGDDGNDRRGLNMALIREIEIPLPSLLNQVEIVKNLKLADESIQELKAQIELKESLAVDLRKSLLSDFLSENREVG